jgi:hypothetical protein
MPTDESNTVMLTKKWKRNRTVWFHGLLSAAILGISHSVAPVLVAPDKFNVTSQWKNLLIIMVVSGMLGAFTFLSKSPLPALPEDYEKDTSV